MITDGRDGVIGYAYYDPDENKTIGFSTLDLALNYYHKVQARGKPQVNIELRVCYYNAVIGTINVDKLSAEISRSNASGHPRQY